MIVVFGSITFRPFQVYGLFFSYVKLNVRATPSIFHSYKQQANIYRILYWRKKNNTGSHTTEHSETQPNLFIYYIQSLCWFYMFKCAAVIALHFPNKTKWKSMMVDSRLKCICVILGVVVFFLSRSEYRSSILIIWYFEYFTRRITIVHQCFRLHKYDGDCECNRQYVLVCKKRRRIKKHTHKTLGYTQSQFTS